MKTFYEPNTLSDKFSDVFFKALTFDIRTKETF